MIASINGIHRASCTDCPAQGPEHRGDTIAMITAFQDGWRLVGRRKMGGVHDVLLCRDCARQSKEGA